MSNLKTMLNPDEQSRFMLYLIEYFMRLEAETENEFIETMNKLQLNQNSDYELLRVIRLRDRMTTIDNIVSDVWKIYGLFK